MSVGPIIISKVLSIPSNILPSPGVLALELPWQRGNMDSFNPRDVL